MITEANFRDLLSSLGFSADTYKDFYENEHSMRVDFAAKRLYYPESIKGRERNNGFDAPENFVVFECVARLLEKGYRPEDIELEKQWNLGHDSKGGRADICVNDENGDTLFIIECKTWGREFDKALKDTKEDGAQLFSYWQQEGACRWLVLYSSDIDDYKAITINCSDDSNLLLLAETDKTIKLYRNSNNVSEKYNVWQETYEGKIHGDLIFSPDSIAYKIGVKPLLKKDLREFTPDEKIVNRFEEILRHNNVSDKENAFNRLIALFICKLVDESTKNEEQEVEFQYKQGSDTYESLQDRLQKLHSEGMEEFMREKIFYVDPEYADRLFSTYRGSNRKKAINELKDTIRKLKFYSNNDFAFKDVHNEELFRQNGKILVEMVQLFEKYRIVYSSKHQFLGDLFEQLLSKGFKQNEGQFFTPMPITRFIWDCLPVESMVESDYPKIIDYACGAGHFLTEAVEAINHFMPPKPCFIQKEDGTYEESDGNNSWVRDRIYGIEKDYRLARVAKISLFMNGAGGGNIIFGDGLENNPDKGIENGAFDILVANPPYSVKDFAQHLQLKNNKFTLLNKIGHNGGEIETLFVERIGQLLKPKGVAAVILPSSILSNDSASYIGAREQLLKTFYIRAIAAFGSKTFGATGTNTVVMFLERFHEPPKRANLFMDSVDAIFNGDDLTEWQDAEIFDEYTKQIKLDTETYSAFTSRTLTLEELEAIEYFRMYVTAFAAKNIKAKDSDEYLRKFYEYAHEIEREKLLYFALVYQQSTLIITAPADNKEQKDFLGYDWSNRKGNEGIQHTNPGGKLYKDDDRAATGTLAHAVRQTFTGDTMNLTDDQRKYASIVNTRDMLDFSRTSFNKAMSLTVNKVVELTSKYPLQSLGTLCEIMIGGTPSRKNPEYFTGNNLWVSIAEMQGQIITDTKEKITDEAVSASNVKLIKAGTTLLSFKLSIGKTAIAGKDLYTNEAIAALIPVDSTQILDKYIYYVFTGKLINLENVGNKAFGKSLNSAYLRNEVKIPVPPLLIQQQIVAECEAVDNEYNTTRMSIEAYRKKIEEIFDELDVIRGGGLKLSLANPDKFSVSIGKRVLNSQLIANGTIPVYSANVKEPFGYIDELLITDFSVPSVLWGIDGDWMTNYMAADTKFYPTDHCGVLRCKTPEVNPRYLVHVLEVEGKKRGFSRSYRASIDRIQGLTFTVPNIDIQDEAIAKVKTIEEQIAIAEAKLESLKGRTAEILKRYL